MLMALVCELLPRDEDPPRNAGKDLPCERLVVELALPARSAPGTTLPTEKALADARQAAARGTSKPLL